MIIVVPVVGSGLGGLGLGVVVAIRDQVEEPSQRVVGVEEEGVEQAAELCDGDLDEVAGGWGGGRVRRRSRKNIVSALVEAVSQMVVQELLEVSRPTTWVAGAATSAAKSGRSAGATGTSRAGARTAEGAIDIAVRCVVLGAVPTACCDESPRRQLRGAGTGWWPSCTPWGWSMRDVEDAFRDATGEWLISKSAVSGITDRLWEDYQAFIARDLAEVQVGVPVRRRGL